MHYTGYWGIIWLLTAAVLVFFVFAQMKLFSIDRTLREIKELLERHREGK